MSILLTLVFIIVLTFIVIKHYGVYESGHPEEKASVEKPIEEARAVECLAKIKALTTDIKMFQVENDCIPQSLDEVSDDYSCPITGDEYEYDGSTGEIWCLEHGKKVSGF